MISSRLLPACVAIGVIRSADRTGFGDKYHLTVPYLEIRFEDSDNLSAGWPEDSDGFDRQVFGLEAQLSSGVRGDHSSGSKLKVLVGKGVNGLRPCGAPVCWHRLRPSYGLSVYSSRGWSTRGDERTTHDHLGHGE